jgi:hypothetical protein
MVFVIFAVAVFLKETALKAQTAGEMGSKFVTVHALRHYLGWPTRRQKCGAAKAKETVPVMASVKEMVPARAKAAVTVNEMAPVKTQKSSLTACTCRVGVT